MYLTAIGVVDRPHIAVGAQFLFGGIGVPVLERDAEAIGGFHIVAVLGDILLIEDRLHIAIELEIGLDAG